MILLKLFKSLSILLEIPVYYILIATLNPSFNIASWTCPMLAAANGYKFISLK